LHALLTELFHLFITGRKLHPPRIGIEATASRAAHATKTKSGVVVNFSLGECTFRSRPPLIKLRVLAERHKHKSILAPQKLHLVIASFALFSFSGAQKEGHSLLKMF